MGAEIAPIMVLWCLVLAEARACGSSGSLLFSDGESCLNFRSLNAEEEYNPMRHFLNQLLNRIHLRPAFDLPPELSR